MEWLLANPSWLDWISLALFLVRSCLSGYWFLDWFFIHSFSKRYSFSRRHSFLVFKFWLLDWLALVLYSCYIFDSSQDILWSSNARYPRLRVSFFSEHWISIPCFFVTWQPALTEISIIFEVVRMELSLCLHFDSFLVKGVILIFQASLPNLYLPLTFQLCFFSFALPFMETSF
jgi:hypothetical protein